MSFNRKGFSLIEVVIVVITIGILAAMVVPKFSNAQSTSRIIAVQEDLLAIERVLVNYRNECGHWPVSTRKGQLPPEIKKFMKDQDPFGTSTHIGGLLDYDNKGTNGVFLSIVPDNNNIGAKMVDALELDKTIDDGVLNTGRFRLSSNGFTYRID